MANPSTIGQSIATLKSKGYSDAEIQAIQFSVPRGDNRRATALFQAAGSYPTKAAPPSAPTPPKPIQPAPPPSSIKDGDAGSRLRINKKAKRRRSGSGAGTSSLRINLNAAPTGAASSGLNVGGS